MLRTLTLLALLWCVPLVASAEQSTEWSFLNKQVPIQWDVRNWTMVESADIGVHIRTDVDGFFTHTLDIPHPVEGVRITLTPRNTVEVIFLWENADVSDDTYLQIPFMVYAEDGQQTIELNVMDFPGWNPRTKVIGLALPAGSEISIQKIEVLSWNFIEEATELFRSFWEFDTMQQFSINFLWGPHVATSSIARAQMFMSNPPRAESANFIFYSVLLLAITVLFLATRRIGRERAITIFLCLCSVLWIFYDVRMGSEILTYTASDWNAYVLRDTPDRMFRGFQDFYAIAEQSEAKLEEHDRYLFIGPNPAIFRSIMRYMTYPSAPIPLEYKQNESIGIVFAREDAVISENGELMLNGEVALTGVRELQRFDDRSFLFEIQ